MSARPPATSRSTGRARRIVTALAGAALASGLALAAAGPAQATSAITIARSTTLAIGDQSVWALAVDTTGTREYAVTDDSLLEMSLASGKPKVTGRVAVSTDTNAQLVLGPGDHFAYLANDELLETFNVSGAAPRLVSRQTIKAQSLSGLAITPSGQCLFANYGTVGASTGLMILKVRSNGIPTYAGVDTAAPADQLAISRNGKTLVTLGWDRGVMAWFDVSTPTRPRLLARGVAVGQSIAAMTMSPNGQSVYAVPGDGSSSGTLERISMSTHKILTTRVYAGDDQLGGYAAVSPDGAYLMVSTGGPGFLVINATTLAPTTGSTSPCGPGAVAFAAAGPAKGTGWFGSSGICTNVTALYSVTGA